MANCSYHGVTQPDSYLEPTDTEVKLSQHLLSLIEQTDVYESPDNISHRHDIVRVIGDILETWICDSIIGDNSREKTEDVSFSKVLEFGRGDLDIVCIVSNVVKREYFMDNFPLELIKHPDITFLRAVKYARVPIIQLTFKDTKVDLCLSIFNKEKIPANIELTEDKIFSDMDQTSVISLNGWRENSSILNLVPCVQSFKETLRVIKYWAKRHHIYHNAIGFPGGVSIAIMVARICQMYPRAAVVKLVEMFYKRLSVWSWPAPIILTEIPEKDPCKLTPWNPKVNHKDGAHLMPVITPAYPQKNSMATASKSTLNIWNEELQTAASLIHILVERNDRDWNMLFSPGVPFYAKYKHYLVVSAISESSKRHTDWSGLIESRLRVLVQMLEGEQSISCLHPYTEAVTLSSGENVRGIRTNWFFGLVIEKTAGSSKSLDLTTHISNYRKHVVTLARDRHISIDGRTVDVYHARRKDLHKFWPEDQR